MNSTLNGRGTRSVTDHATGATLTGGGVGTVHTNKGATGPIVLALPAATVGMRFGFRVQAAQELRIDPNGLETIGLPSTGVQGAGGKYLWADAVGEWVDIECLEAGKWFVVGYAGTWTAEP
jgi:hypothetical protein